MWANAQRDGHPAEYRWRPLFNAAKFGWCPLVECRAVTLPRRQTRWNLHRCSKLTKRSQPLVGRSSPYCGHVWRRYCCLTSFFFWLSIHALVASPLAVEIVSGVWGTPATFSGFRVLAALLHGSQAMSVSQTLRRLTEGATYVRQGDYHVGHWPIF